MSRHRVIVDEIRVGQPLPWDVYDADGVLLLRRGYVIDTQRSLERLIEEGMFVADQAGREADPPPEPEPEKPSALQFIMDARRLMALPQDISTVPDFPARMLRVAQCVDLACKTHADVAIASILLLQDHSYTARHHINTAIVSNLLARAMSLSEDHVRKITAAALTMNVSMYEIQDKLHEFKGALNDRIRNLINVHPQQSEQRLRKLGVDDPLWLKCVEQHHELEDGSGYHQGSRSAEIEIGAKIVGLADRYCARVSIRNYRPPQPPTAVLRDLYIEGGAKIDPIIAAYLLRIVSIYPPGTIVRLRNGEIAVVVEQSDSPDNPVAYAVLGPSGAALTVPSVRKTVREAFKIQDVLTVDKVDFPIQMSRLWGNTARLV